MLPLVKILAKTVSDRHVRQTNRRVKKTPSDITLAKPSLSRFGIFVNDNGGCVRNPWECLVDYFRTFTPQNQTSRVVTSFIVISHTSTGPFWLICIDFDWPVRYGIAPYCTGSRYALVSIGRIGTSLYSTDLYCCRYFLKTFHWFFLLFVSPFYLFSSVPDF